MVTVRDWQDDDTDWWVDLRRRWDPTKSVAQLRLIASGTVGGHVTRRVAVDDGHRLGAAVVTEPSIQGYSANVVVDPRVRGRGVGSLLWHDVLARTPDVPLFTFLPDRDEHGIAISQHWGFRTVTHGISSACCGVLTPPSPTRASRG
jgi:GNAT superfamily N-acetyltransferase